MVGPARDAYTFKMAPKTYRMDGGLQPLLRRYGSQLSLIPTNVQGLPAAMVMRRRLQVLQFPVVLLVAPSSQACAHGGVPCLFMQRCAELPTPFDRVLCAKLNAISRLFGLGADLFITDSDVHVFHNMAAAWASAELRGASIIAQGDTPQINTGMLRIQHVGQGADAMTRWLLDEWRRRTVLVSTHMGGCSGCDQSILNELLVNLATGTCTMAYVLIPGTPQACRAQACP